MTPEYEMWRTILIPLILLIGLFCAMGLACVWVVEGIIDDYWNRK